MLGRLVADLMLDTERSAMMGTLGRERICERFDWQVVADRSAELFRSIGS